MMFAKSKCKKNNFLKITYVISFFIIVFLTIPKIAFSQQSLNNCQALGGGRSCYDVGSQYNICKDTAGCTPGYCEGNTTICCTVDGYNQCIAAVSSEEQKTTLPNPIGTTDVKVLIARIISTVLGLVGAIALALFVYGGLVWMTAGGSPDKIKKGKDILVWAVLGLALIFASYIILNFIFGSLEIATH